MRCCDVERLWDEMRDGVEPRREHVLAHLRACPECQEIYRENEGIAYCLTCLPPVDPPPRLVPKILDHIKATVKISAPDSVTTLDSPLGRLFVAFRHTGITAVALDRGEGEEAVLVRLQKRLARGLIPSEAPKWVADTVSAFFRTHKPDLAKVDISDLSAFEQSALRAAASIPPGEVRSYGWIAQTIGQPSAVRAVGRAMARNPVPLLYPCHRVVDANGALHHYAYGVEVKARILEMEGYRPVRR
ncbi:MAG: methylated-DNA--[protein]-cysteine S-methyltransferase [Candidatus Eremiobacteraeota bacterium]|nr:methylated-DNA--[protein]-cysteine S-methyltransferase [Candidatus Eremiobacteraeota bacterium]